MKLLSRRNFLTATAGVTAAAFTMVSKGGSEPLFRSTVRDQLSFQIKEAVPHLKDEVAEAIAKDFEKYAQDEEAMVAAGFAAFGAVAADVALDPSDGGSKEKRVWEAVSMNALVTAPATFVVSKFWGKAPKGGEIASFLDNKGYGLHPADRDRIDSVLRSALRAKFALCSVPAAVAGGVLGAAIGSSRRAGAFRSKGDPAAESSEPQENTPRPPGAE